MTVHHYRMHHRNPHRKQRGGFFPLLLAAIPAIAATIASAIAAAKSAKDLRGGRLSHMRVTHRKHMGHTHRKHMGHGLAVMRISGLNSTAGGYHGGRLALPGQRRLGNGLLSAAGAGKRAHVRRAHARYVRKGAGVKRVHVRAHKVGGYIPFY